MIKTKRGFLHSVGHINCTNNHITLDLLLLPANARLQIYLNCASFVADLFLFCYERDFMLSLSDDNQCGVIEAFNSTSRYLNDLLNDNIFFDSKVNHIYPSEFLLNKANVQHCHAENERGLRLLEFATFNNLVLTNTLGPHKPSRRWTWHSPDGKHHNQIDYILVKKRFRSGVNIHRTRSFPGADIGSDHDLVMMTFQVRLKKTRKPNQPRLRFDLEKLRDPDVACTFQATIGRKFAPLIELSDEDIHMDTMITTYNTAVTDAASEILGKERRRKKPWVTKDVLDLRDERRDLKKKRYEAEGAKNTGKHTGGFKRQ